MAGAGCDGAQRRTKSHVLFRPLPSLASCLLLNGVIPGAGGDQRDAGGGAAALRAQ